jgi:DNA topoisomerase IA
MIEVLKQALTDAKRNERHNNVAETRYWFNQYKLIAEQALAQLALDAKAENARELGLDYEQEPVAWQVEVYINGGWSPMGNSQLNKSRAEALASNPSLPKEKQRIVELYTHPPQRTWVGISEQDLKQGDESFFVAWREGARWAEAKLKELNDHSI